MCELFAINGRRDVRADGYLTEFFGHGVQNPHGWGVALRVDRLADAPDVRGRETIADDEHGLLLRWREPVEASSSALARELVSSPLTARHLLAHIRKATCATLSRENCHPFVGMDVTGRTWAMVHNGVLFNEGMLWGYERRTAGQTDSERTLLFLLDVLDEASLRNEGSLGFEKTFDALSEAIGQLGNLNKLNLILDDGQFTFVHTNTDEPTLHYREATGIDGRTCATMFATTSLGGEGERDAWRPVPRNRLLAYRDGRLVRASVPHGNVFCDAILTARRALGGIWEPQSGPLTSRSS